MISSLDRSFTQLNQFLKTEKPSKIFILCDEHTHEYCLPVLLPELETEIPFEIIEIAAGEEMKTLDTAAQLWDILIDFKADRKALMINVGGGVITDMGGFIASTYKRGLRFVHLPTTLLAMCDASIGGKTGIDHAFLKNVIGTFSLPQQIFLFPDFLKTLPFEQLRSGFAEMLKHGLIADAKHWQALSQLSELTTDHLAPHIQTSMNIKKQVVESDFTEQGERKILNFGHTVGHAIESLFLAENRPLLHGEAVAAGMICETYLSVQAGSLEQETAEEIISALVRWFPLIDLAEINEEELMQLMQNDKKNNQNQILFVLLKAIGTAVFDVEIRADLVLESITFYKTLAKKS